MTSRCRSFDVLTRSTQAFVVALALLALTACGGSSSSPTGSSSPVGPSALAAVTVNGSVVGSSGASSSSAAGVGGSSPLLTRSILSVSVQENPTLFTTIGADGSFTLHGLPAGSFTLVFTRDGTRVGSLSFSGVLPDQEVNITISLTPSALVLLSENRNGAGHGDLEIEGTIEQILLLNPVGESRFLIRSYTVVSRPGLTVIRRGNATRSATDLTVGLRVHVKAVRLPAEGSVEPVLANEIKIQTDDDDDDDEEPTPTPTPSASPTPTPGATPSPSPSPVATPRALCMIEDGVPGRNIELEGTILSGGLPSFTLSLKKGQSAIPVEVVASGATIGCTPKSGPKAPTPAQCTASVKPGATVEVNGILIACSATSAQVLASKVEVGK